MRARLLSLPLFWRVYLTNAVVLGLAFLALVLAPVTVSAPVAATELLLLACGLLALLAVNLLLLRPAFGPLQELAGTMRRHDPLSPGTRARVVGVRTSSRSPERSMKCSTGWRPSGARARGTR